MLCLESLPRVSAVNLEGQASKVELREGLAVSSFWLELGPDRKEKAAAVQTPVQAVDLKEVSASGDKGLMAQTGDFVKEHWSEGLALGVLLGGAVMARRHLAAGAEISAFVRKNPGHFLPDEAKVLRSINWRAEGRLPSLLDARNPKAETLVIGKLKDLERYEARPSEFMLRWPDEKYTAFSKAQNLSLLHRWLKSGGSVLDVSGSNVESGFLHTERAFIGSVSKKFPGQYLHQITGRTEPPLASRIKW